MEAARIVDSRVVRNRIIRTKGSNMPDPTGHRHEYMSVATSCDALSRNPPRPHAKIAMRLAVATDLPLGALRRSKQRESEILERL